VAFALVGATFNWNIANLLYNGLALARFNELNKWGHLGIGLL
jgi:hypothetical protein